MPLCRARHTCNSYTIIYRAQVHVHVVEDDETHTHNHILHLVGQMLVHTHTHMKDQYIHTIDTLDKDFRKHVIVIDNPAMQQWLSAWSLR